ncbi:MAG: hypothetical protein IKE94_04590 [Aeriscardovia sp.]|nr:hypothetical protein [Aeriscardovia sp.]
MTEEQAYNLCIAVVEQTKKDYMNLQNTEADLAKLNREIRQSMFFNVVCDPDAVIRAWGKELEELRSKKKRRVSK